MVHSCRKIHLVNLWRPWLINYIKHEQQEQRICCVLSKMNKPKVERISKTKENFRKRWSGWKQDTVWRTRNNPGGKMFLFFTKFPPRHGKGNQITRPSGVESPPFLTREDRLQGKINRETVWFLCFLTWTHLSWRICIKINMFISNLNASWTSIINTYKKEFSKHQYYNNGRFCSKGRHILYFPEVKDFYFTRRTFNTNYE